MKKFFREDHSMFVINLKEKTYGDVQVIVIDGEVTVNSILGETYEDM